MSALLWGNPMAWLGLAAVAVPVVVHLLAMRRATRVPFPTLRFLADASTTSVRRHRIEDLPLLLLRCLIVAVAVMALAQPWVSSEGRARAPGTGLARAIVVDTSASMSRDTVVGSLALADALADASRLANQSSSAITIESVSVAAGIARAAVWLRAAAAEGRATELVVISDFQVGALEGRDLLPLPAPTGVQVSRIEVARRPEVEMPPFSLGGRRWAAEATLDNEQTSVRWSEFSDSAADTDAIDINWLAGEGEREGAAAAIAAAAAVVAVPTDAPTRLVTVVGSRAPERAELLAAGETIIEPWMAEVLVGLSQEAAISAARRQGARLFVFTDTPPGGLASASLAAALSRATLAGGAPVAELEPGTIDDAVLREWQRPAGEASTPVGSDGRWLWLATLALLMIEQRVRRHD